MKAILFTNFTNEDFTCSWNNDPTTIEAGQSILLQDWLAEHFALHLIDRELNKQNKQTNMQHLRNEMLAKCMGKTFEAENRVKLDTKILQEAVVPEVKPEPKEEVKPKSKKNDEEEFAGLKK